MEASYKICCDDSLGRHLVATRVIPRGTVILQEPPLVRGPFFHTYPVCVGCGKLLSSGHPCKTCGWPLCNETCQHSSGECLLTIQRGTPISIKHFGVQNPNYQFVVILRALSLKKTAPEAWNKLMTLQGHSIDVNLAPPGFIRQLFKLEDWSQEEIKKVCEILVVNGHELPLIVPSQLVVYHEVSFFEHSCRANCTKTFTNEGDIIVVAAEDIQEGDHLSICYTDPLWGVENRRQHLHQTKHFWCSCSRCEDPTDFGSNLNSLRCLTPECPGLLLPRSFLEKGSPWRCTTCSDTTSNETVAILSEKIGVEVSQMPKDVASCKDFLKKYEGVVAPSHFYMIDVKMALAAMLSSENYEDLNDEDLDLLLKISEEVKDVAEMVAPAETRLLGLMKYRRAKCKIEKGRRCEEPQKFLEALQVSKTDFSEVLQLLSHEPSLLPEGRLRFQITLDLNLIDTMLKKN